MCIFVNDTCTAPVVQALASLGVELIALRCAGFNHVHLEALSNIAETTLDNIVAFEQGKRGTALPNAVRAE